MSITFIKQPNTPKVIFSPIAYATMQLALEVKIVESLEFMFLGEVYRKDESKFFVDKIVFAPQAANSGAYVETDDDRYPEWLNTNYPKVPDRQRLRLHGHSHVNMATSPSATDNKLMESMLNNISDFFIQLIINKRGDYTLNLFDKETNLIFKNIPYYVAIGKYLIKMDGAKALFNKPKDFLLANYKCQIADNILFFDDSLAFDFVSESFILTDKILLCHNQRIEILEKETILEELTKTLTEVVKPPVVLTTRYTQRDYEPWWDNDYTYYSQPTTGKVRRTKGVVKK